MSAEIVLVVAMDEAGTLGLDGDLPWRLSADLRHFKRVTMGKPMLMGRRTFDSIGKPLPGRDNLVLSRDPAFRRDGVVRVESVDQALKSVAGQSQLMVIGGAQVFSLVLPHAHRMHLTRVHARVRGDTFFPTWNAKAWRELSREDHPADDRNDYTCSFVELVRR